MERIDNQIGVELCRLVGAVGHPEQEMAGKVDTFDPHTGSPGYLYVDQCEGDRNTGSSVEHRVEQVVTRVVVLLESSGKSLFFKEIVVQCLDPCSGIVHRCVRQTPGGGHPHLVEPVQVARRV